jgi:hypothetical protein
MQLDRAQRGRDLNWDCVRKTLGWLRVATRHADLRIA